MDSNLMINENEWNFHHGKNHDMTPYGSENKYICYHETGQFGSGTYFSTYTTPLEKKDDMRKYVHDSNNTNPEFIQVGNGVYRVDFDIYKNLYRVYSETQGDILHTMCSYLNSFYHHVSGFGLGHYYPKMADFNNARIYQIIKGNSSSLGLKCPSYMELTRMAQKHAQSEEKQSFSTLFMEWNGFNGVNVSGIHKFDNSRHGSVIYDLSKTSLEPVEHDSTGWFNRREHSHTGTIASKDIDDRSMAMVDSLDGQTSYRFYKLDEKDKLRAIKNIFQSNKIGNDTVSRLLYQCDDSPRLKNYIFRQLYNSKKISSDITLDSSIFQEIINNKQYYFVNYKPNANYYGWRRVNFLEEFLDDYKWHDGWDASKEQLQAFLDKVLSYLKRPLTDSEREYIKQDYFGENEMNESKKLDKIVKSALNESVRKIITEVNNVYKTKHLDDECPFFNKIWDNGFSIAEMVQYDDPDERIDYAGECLECLGRGLRRTVFKLNDRYILKLSNGSHRWQTKNEYDTEFLMSGKYNLFPRIIYQSRDFTWTISEYARPLSNSECEQILGIPLYSESELDPSLEGFQLWAETKGRQATRKKLNGLANTSTPYNSYTFLRNVKYAEKGMPCDEIYSSLVKTNPWFKQLMDLERHSRGDLAYGTDIAQGGMFQGKAFGVVNRNGHPWVVFTDAGFIKPFDIQKTKRKYPKTTVHDMENLDFGRC